MRIIDFDTINKLNISYTTCVDWVEKAFKLKEEVLLPAKISLKLNNNVFFNTMPCYVPSINKIGVKLVSRYPNRIPSVNSELLLFDSNSGDLIAFMNADWITTMRTGAVAALAIKTLRPTRDCIYSFIGLGNTARATLLCLLSTQSEVFHRVKLLAYKGQESLFIDRFNEFSNVEFEIVDSPIDLIKNADVLVSGVTAYDSIFAPDEYYKEGILLVPVHTRGFQNCDLFFDKIFGDDLNHIKDFKYFSSFKEFHEFSDVLLGINIGRENNFERIIAYNIGIALHDVYFASQILDQIDLNEFYNLELSHPNRKFWI